jgi:hypothetical protein
MHPLGNRKTTISSLQRKEVEICSGIRGDLKEPVLDKQQLHLQKAGSIGIKSNKRRIRACVRAPPRR